MFYKIFTFILLLFIPLYSFAGNIVNPDLEVRYNSIISQLEKKYWEKKLLSTLESVNDSLDIILKSNNISERKISIVEDIKKINYEKIFKINLNLVSQNSSTVQKIKEINERKKLEAWLINKFSDPTFVDSFKKKWFKIYNINDDLEFVEQNSIKKLQFSKYYLLSNTNYNWFTNKKWIIVYKVNSWEYWYVEDYKVEEKIKYSQAQDYFYDYVEFDDNLFFKNNDIYTYNFPDFTYFQWDYWFYLSDLNNSWIEKDKTVLYKDEDWKYVFLKNFEEVKLVSNDIVFWLKNKKSILKNIKDDKKFLYSDTDETYQEIKELSLSINKWLKSDEEKIKAAYDWILSNISYTTKFKLSDYRIYSWVLTYKYKDWVCDGYVKLFSYLLEFAWLDDLEIIRWYVLDAKDFPKVWHAWIKIWDYYYDPTFDDPIWSLVAKKFEEYKYFKLPKDLFYANRYTYKDLPVELETASEELRKKIIDNNLKDLSKKYKGSNYLLLKPYDFQDKYWVEDLNNVSISTLKTIIPYYEVNEFSYNDENWNNIKIKGLKYYGIDDEIAKTVVSQLNFELDWYYLFKWNLWDWTYEYRLAYNVEKY